jgi:hypothetical protein
VSAPALATIGGDITIGTAVLSLPALTHCRSILDTTGYLTNLDLPALTTVTGVGPGHGVIDIRYSHLTTLSMPSLQQTNGKLNIQRNLSLTSISFPQLVSIGSLLRIFRNPALPTCYATNLRDQLLANGWTGDVIISGNGTGTCP